MYTSRRRKGLSNFPYDKRFRRRTLETKSHISQQRYIQRNKPILFTFLYWGYNSITKQFTRQLIEWVLRWVPLPVPGKSANLCNERGARGGYFAILRRKSRHFARGNSSLESRFSTTSNNPGDGSVLPFGGFVLATSLVTFVTWHNCYRLAAPFINPQLSQAKHAFVGVWFSTLTVLVNLLMFFQWLIVGSVMTPTRASCGYLYLFQPHSTPPPSPINTHTHTHKGREIFVLPPNHFLRLLFHMTRVNKHECSFICLVKFYSSELNRLMDNLI